MSDALKTPQCFLILIETLELRIAIFSNCNKCIGVYEDFITLFKAEETARLKAVLLKHAVTDTFLLTSILLKIYWIPVMSHFSDLSDITLNMYYINSSHHLNTLLIISVPVDTASPSPLCLQSSCAKTSLTACYSMMIYIDVL